MQGSYVEDWLVKIAEYTRRTAEAVEGRAGGGTGGIGGAAARGDAWIDRLGKRLESAVGGAIASKVGQAQGLANRGLAGSAEQSRYDYAMEQLSKQFAAVMSPVMQAMAYGAEQIERRMRNMSGSEQNRMMGGLIGAGIGLRYGGALGALAGYGVGAMLGGDSSNMSTEGRIAAVLGAAYIGGRVGAVGGPWGAAAGATVAGAGTAVGTSSDYARLRAGGKYRAEAALGTAGMAVYDAGYWINESLGTMDSSPLDEARAEYDRRPVGLRMKTMPDGTKVADEKKSGWFSAAMYNKYEMDAGRYSRPPEAHRDVSPFASAMDEAGGFAARAQEGVTRATAGAGADGGPLQPIVDLMLKIFDTLVQINGGREPEPRLGAAAGAGM